MLGRVGRDDGTRSWARALRAIVSPAAALLRLPVAACWQPAVVLHSCAATSTCWLVLAPMLAAHIWPALVLVHREWPHRDARDQTWPSSARISCPASSTRSVLRAVMMLLSKLHLAFLHRIDQLALQPRERPPLDLSDGVRNVGSRLQRPGCAAPTDELCCCCAAVAEWRALLRHTSPALEPPLLA